MQYKTFIVSQCYQVSINIAYKLIKKPSKKQLNGRFVPLSGNNDLIFAFHPLHSRLPLSLDREIFKVLTLKISSVFLVFKIMHVEVKKLHMVKTDTLK